MLPEINKNRGSSNQPSSATAQKICSYMQMPVREELDEMYNEQKMKEQTRDFPDKERVQRSSHLEQS